jgi:hypothetical protein
MGPFVLMEREISGMSNTGYSWINVAYPLDIISIAAAEASKLPGRSQ